MRALIGKEVRDLSISLYAVLGTAVVLAFIDLAYNYEWARYEGLALSIWTVLAFVIAFLGGASSLARESRQGVVFLNSWPYPRATLWSVKTLVSAAATFLAIGFGFLICLSVVDFSSESVDLRAWVAPETWTALGYGLPLCFAFALLWSTLLSPTLAAAGLGLATVVGLGAGYGYVLAYYLPTEWGPYFGNIGSPTLWKVAGVLLALIALVTAGHVFVRYPVLETRRRLWRGLVTLVLLAVIGLGGLAGWQGARRPSLAQPLRADSLGLVGDSICFATSASSGGGVWTLPHTGGTPRLVAKGNPRYDDACGNSLYLGYGPMLEESITWSADTATRALRRLPERFHMASPSGRYTVIQPPDLFKLVIYDGNRPVVTVPLEGDIVFSPDSRYAYYLSPSVRVTRLDLQTRQTQSVMDIPDVSFLQQISPDGRYLVAQATDKARPSGAEHTPSSESTLLILDLQTRRLYRFPNIWTTTDSFLDNRHLVVRYRPFGPEGPAVFYFLDTATMRMANARPFWGFSTESTPLIAHHTGVPYAVVYVLVKPSGATPAKFHLWRFNPDGSGLRDLGEQQGDVLGMAPDGNVIIWDKERSFASYDPRTGKRRHIATIGRSQEPSS